jgi:esterase
VILNAAEIGQGPPLILLHGLFGHARNLATLARRLSPDFRVISLDLRNHGASPHAPGMSYRAMTEDVIETLVAYDALPAAILGHSMGGKVAMMLALTYPQSVSRLMVADIAPVFYRHLNRALTQAMLELPLPPGLTRGQADRALSRSISDDSVRGFLLQNLLTGPSPAWRIGLENIDAGMAEIEGFPPLAGAACYPGPTFFIRGGRSNYVEDKAIPAISALFPAARIETIPEAGHWLHADQPDAFGAAVQQFLRDGVDTRRI